MSHVIGYLKPFRAKIFLAVLLVAGQSACDLLLPSFMSSIVNNGIAQNNIGYIFATGFIMLLITLAGCACTVGAGYLAARIAAGYSKSLRSAVFSKVENYSLTEFDTFGASSLITRTTNDTQQMQTFIVMGIRVVVSAPITFIGGVFMTLYTDIELAYILLAAVPVLIGILLFIVLKASPRFNVMQKKIDRINQIMREKLTGVRVIRAFNTTEHERERFAGANEDLMKTARSVHRLMASMVPSLTLVLNFVTIGVVWFGATRVDQGFLQAGNLMAVVQYVVQIMLSLVMVGMIFVFLPRVSVSAKRIEEVLTAEATIVDPAQSQPPADHKRGYLTFENVSFRYGNSEDLAIENISFEARPGQTTAIIGSTGSGKSTIVNLIPRFYDPTSGRILLNGLDIKDITQHDLRERIGFVPQRAVLFSGTIRENICFGKKDATDEQVHHAAEIAQALDFIQAKPEGFDSYISQGGTNVSGGQKQRLSIARAIVKNPEIYVFDDSFSALDFKTDATLRAALKKETKDATVIIVAQRISSIMDADTILVLDNGRVVGKGTHKELLASCQVYREIASSQLSKEEMDA